MSSCERFSRNFISNRLIFLFTLTAKFIVTVACSTPFKWRTSTMIRRLSSTWKWSKRLTLRSRASMTSWQNSSMSSRQRMNCKIGWNRTSSLAELSSSSGCLMTSRRIRKFSTKLMTKNFEASPKTWMESGWSWEGRWRRTSQTIPNCIRSSTLRIRWLSRADGSLSSTTGTHIGSSAGCCCPKWFT